MQYFKYLKQGQKVLLRPSACALPAGRYEVLTAYVRELGPDYFDLALPYRTPAGETYPFFDEMPFEIYSDAMGLGIKLSGTFQKQLNEDLIRVKLHNDLQVFQRRSLQRVDARTGLRYTKGTGTLRSFRDQWQRNIHILEGKGNISKLPAFPSCPVNISASGIRFNIKASAEVADLCLLLLELDKTGPPVCALAEVVWMEEEVVDGKRTAGLQFINILESDRARIENFVRRREGEQRDERDRANGGN